MVDAAQSLGSLPVYPDEFGISEVPAFGMNSVFIGGDSRHGEALIQNQNPWSPTVPGEYLAALRLSEVKNPSRVIVFGSSMRDPEATGPDGSRFNLFFGSPELRPPYLQYDLNGQGIGAQQWEVSSVAPNNRNIVAAGTASFANGGGWPIARWGKDLVPVAHLDGSTIAVDRYRMAKDGSMWSPFVTAPARRQDTD